MVLWYYGIAWLENPYFRSKQNSSQCSDFLKSYVCCNAIIHLYFFSLNVTRSTSTQCVSAPFGFHFITFSLYR